MAFAGLAACSPLQPGPPASLTPNDVFEATKPAAVIIEADNAVTWSVPQPVLTPQKQQQLQSRLVAMVRAGQVASDQAAIGQAAVQLLVGSPGSWFSTGSSRHQQTDSVLTIGTGFFVTEDGYLLTNDHVVETSAVEIKQQLLDELQRESTDAGQLSIFRNEMSSSLGVPVGTADARRLFLWMLGVFQGDVQVSSVSPTYRIGFGSMSSGDIKAKGMPVRLIAHGQAAPGRDVAVLKASGGPFVTVAAARATPGQGEPLDVIGYPCGCSTSQTYDPAHVLDPVLTRGTVRARMRMAGGWDALGTDAPIEHGNSGGPVLDGEGEVVGLATFSDPGAGVGPGVPRSFAVPIEVARQFTDRAHVRMAQGQLGKDYALAVEEFRQEHYRAALPMFQRAAAAPDDPYAQRYLAETRAAIAAGKDRTPSFPLDALGLFGSVLALAFAVCAGGAVVVFLRRRSG